MLSSYWHEFLSLALIHFLAVLAPGPDFAITIRQSVRYGRRAGIFTALGIGAGISVHVLYTLLGISALLHASPWLMTAAQAVGGAYLLYLGIRFLRSQPATAMPLEPDATPAHTGQQARRSFWIGFMTNATNPKATLFFLAVFSSVVQRTTPLSIQALYGVWMCMVNALWFVLVCILFSNARVRQRFIRSGYWVDRAMGVVLVAFALRLLLSSV